jgi:hypothetical protein
VHHGNGTQEIFQGNKSVSLLLCFCVSGLLCFCILGGDISRYGRISLDIVGYDRVYLDIFKHGRISPDMVGYDKYVIPTCLISTGVFLPLKQWLLYKLSTKAQQYHHPIPPILFFHGIEPKHNLFFRCPPSLPNWPVHPLDDLLAPLREITMSISTGGHAVRGHAADQFDLLPLS